MSPPPLFGGSLHLWCPAYLQILATPLILCAYYFCDNQYSLCQKNNGDRFALAKTRGLQGWELGFMWRMLTEPSYQLRISSPSWSVASLCHLRFYLRHSVNSKYITFLLLPVISISHNNMFQVRAMLMLRWTWHFISVATSTFLHSENIHCVHILLCDINRSVLFVIVCLQSGTYSLNAPPWLTFVVSILLLLQWRNYMIMLLPKTSILSKNQIFIA